QRGASPTRAPAIPEGPAPLPSAAAHDHDHDHDHEHEHGHAHPPAGPRPPVSAGAEELAADPEAKKLADAWLFAFAAGDVAKVQAKSSLPFHSGDTVIARTREEMRDVLAAMVGETGGQRPKGTKVYTASGLRKVFGSVPSGVQEGIPRVYALTRFGKDYVILMLERRFGAWRVVGWSR